MSAVPGLGRFAAERTGCLVAAGGEAWEVAALRSLEDAGMVVVKRCVDVTDLLASAPTGQAAVAVVSAGLGGLDADAVTGLLRSDVRTVAVVAGEAADAREAARLSRLGVLAVVGTDPGQIVAAVGSVAARELLADPRPAVPDEPLPIRAVAGKVVAVWGPAGGPGRTTVATTLAAARARTYPAILVDADPYGGAVAQHLGVLDEVSGLLAAARLANTGGLDRASLAGCRRRIGDRLDVLTGLPRADRWIEVRSGVLAQILEQACEVADVVVDTGFSIERDPDSPRRLERNQLTLDALETAEEVVVVGSADPTGLARLARGLVEVQEEAPGVACRVVVNRMRDSLGWSRADVVGMIEGYASPVGVHFLPDDRPGVDRALVVGRSLVEIGDTALGRALEEVTAAVFPAGPVAGPLPAPVPPLGTWPVTGGPAGHPPFGYGQSGVVPAPPTADGPPGAVPGRPPDRPPLPPGNPYPPPPGR